MQNDGTYQPMSGNVMGYGMSSNPNVSGSHSMNTRDQLNTYSTNMRRIDINDGRHDATPNQDHNGSVHGGHMSSSFQMGANQGIDMHHTPSHHSHVSAFQSERKDVGAGLNVSRGGFGIAANNDFYQVGHHHEKAEPYNRPLFEGDVTVNIRELEREQRQAILHIKISIFTIGPQRHQSLRIELTDESDPFFLYSMDCGETEFHILKTEQNLLVDFQTFPDKFIELLNLCGGRNAQMIGSPKFLCVLHCSQGEFSEFNIVETNQFKHLTHLALKFRSGNDDSLKKYLAQKLKFFKSESEEFRARYENSEGENKSRQIENEQLSQEIQRLKNEMERLAEELRLEEKKKLNEQKEQMLQSQDDAVNRLNDERESMSRKFENQITDLQTKNQEYMAENKELSQRKLDLEATNRELNHDLSTTRHELEMARNELAQLRDQNKNLDTTKYSQEKSISEITLKNGSLERQLEDKEQIIQKLNSLLETTKAQKDSAEENAGMFKANSEKLEDKLNISVREINKGNTIIQELQNDINNYKAKLKQKNLVLKQQEQEMESRRNSLNDTSLQVRELQAEVDKKIEELKLAENTSSDLRSKLEESRKIIESNTNMIQWLNTSLSKAQKPASHYLGAGGAGHVPSMSGTSSSHLPPSGLGAGSTIKPGFSSNYSGIDSAAAGGTVGFSSGYSAPIGGIGSSSSLGGATGVGAGATFKPTYSTIEEITSKTATLTTSPNVRGGVSSGDYMNASTSTPGGIGSGTRPLGNSLLANSNPGSERKGNDIRYSPYSAASATSLSTNEVQGSAANYMKRVKTLSSASSVKSEDHGGKVENPENNISDAILPIQYRQPNA